MVSKTDRNITSVLLLAALLAGAIACDDGVLADGDSVVYLTPWGGDQVEAVQVGDAPPQLSEQDEANAEKVMTSFEEQAEVLLERPGVEDILGQVEQSFMLSGKYLQLVRIYRDQYERYGTDSIAAAALAWTHIQLGNEVELVEMERTLIDERPDDPLTWVVVGEANMRRAGQSVEAAVRARDAFERVLELDPEFQGFKSLERSRLREQLQRLKAEVPDEVAEGDVPETEFPMHHVDDDAAPDPNHQQQARRRAEQVAEEAAEETAMAMAEQFADAVDDDEEQDVDEADEKQQRAVQYILRGQQAYQQGGSRLPEARQFFEKALDYDAENIDARIGLLRVDERRGVSETELTGAVDELADRNLTAQQAYDLGLFCLRSLNDRDRATSLLERVEDLDPSFARRVGVDSLLH